MVLNWVLKMRSDKYKHWLLIDAVFTLSRRFAVEMALLVFFFFCERSEKTLMLPSLSKSSTCIRILNKTKASPADQTKFLRSRHGILVAAAAQMCNL